MGSFTVPPGGFAGFSQMTPASRAALGGIGAHAVRSSRRQGVKVGRKKRRKAKAKRASSRRKSTGRKMKFGSPASQKKYKVGKFRK